ncbi:MAG: SulP family inorganic anion transporter [Acidobacteriota bacterium]|nr:SulP family inorganic anion transporter [Acidobacteriota bacterium]
MNQIKTKPKTGLGENLANDFLASFVVFLVALPLCMGIAIASGVPPALGLITGIVGGLVVGAVSGSTLQITGPAAGLTVLVWEIIQQHGVAMLGAIVLLAGLMQLLVGALKIGQWFRAISPSVIQGMLAGIGVLIIASQIHVMVDDSPKNSGLTNLLSIPEAIYKGFVPIDGSSHYAAASIGLITLGLIFAWSYAPKKLQVVPAPLAAIIIVTIGAMIVAAPVKYVSVPGNLASAISFPTMEALGNWLDWSVVGSAIALCFVASAETLLCSTSVDRMHNGERTQYNKELIAQGVGNSICGLFGALPMAGVIVRSSANVNAGGKTRASSMLHGAWILGVVVLAPFMLSRIPTTALAAILVYTGFKLLSPKALRELKPFGWQEIAIYFVTILGIVATNLLVGVMIGLALSLLKLLFTFSHLDVQTQVELDSDDTTIVLSGAATFVRLPKLAAALESVPVGTTVKLEIDRLHYIDHACLDLISNWCKQHISRAGRVEVSWEDLQQRNLEREIASSVASKPNLVVANASGD